MPNGKISEVEMNSLNHYAYGSIVDWMYKSMCGINSVEDKPGFRKISISPKPYGRLKYSKAKFNSPTGYIESGWNIKEYGQLEIKLVIPFNTEAEVILPDAKINNIYINGKN